VALRYNLHITQGETFQLTVPVLPDDPNNPAGLAGLTARAQVRADPASTVVLHEWSTAAGNITLTDSAVILTLTAATSSSWLWRRGVYDLELTDPATGGAVRLVEGWVFVRPETTRN
jgi:hypothetical protein